MHPAHEDFSNGGIQVSHSALPNGVHASSPSNS
jgi:hypothetical protein